MKTTREGDRIAVDESAVIARVRSGEPEAYAELVRAHGGTIRVMDDDSGHDLAKAWPGARFEIRLPTARGSA